MLCKRVCPNRHTKVSKCFRKQWYPSSLTSLKVMHIQSHQIHQLQVSSKLLLLLRHLQLVMLVRKWNSPIGDFWPLIGHEHPPWMAKFWPCSPISMIIHASDNKDCLHFFSKTCAMISIWMALSFCLLQMTYHIESCIKVYDEWLFTRLSCVVWVYIQIHPQLQKQHKNSRQGLNMSPWNMAL